MFLNSVSVTRRDVIVQLDVDQEEIFPFQEVEKPVVHILLHNVDGRVIGTRSMPEAMELAKKRKLG